MLNDNAITRYRGRRKVTRNERVRMNAGGRKIRKRKGVKAIEYGA